MKSLLNFATVVAFLIAPATCPAALITTNELGMDGIFSQTSFGNETVDIRFNAPITVVNPSLLTIDTEAKLLTLLAVASAPTPTVNMYFVDALDWCGVHNASIVGCATLPGNDVILESATAAGGFGAELNAHELGHTLGLDHSGSGLMASALNGNTTLSSAQVSTIFASSLIQVDGSQRFISVTPVLITSTPEPSSLALGSLAIVGLFFFRRRRGLGLSDANQKKNG